MCPIGGKKHQLAVGRPAAGVVVAGMPGELAGVAAFDRHDVDVAIARPVGGERQGASIGRELGIGLHRGSAGEPSGLASRLLDDPEIAAILEGDAAALTVGWRSSRVPWAAGSAREPGSRGARSQQGAAEQPRRHGWRLTLLSMRSSRSRWSPSPSRRRILFHLAPEQERSLIEQDVSPRPVHIWKSTVSISPWPSSKVANCIGSSLAVCTGLAAGAFQPPAPGTPTCSASRVAGTRRKRNPPAELHGVAVGGEREARIPLAADDRECIPEEAAERRKDAKTESPRRPPLRRCVVASLRRVPKAVAAAFSSATLSQAPTLMRSRDRRA